MKKAKSKLKKAIKYDGGKPKMALVPPRAIESVARVMTFGAMKYAAENYLAGDMTYRQLLSACGRHINTFLQNEDTDAESLQSHLANGACCLLMLLEGILTGTMIDDRWKPRAKKKKARRKAKRKAKK